MKTYVYFFVAFEVRKVKIGVSQDVKHRLWEIQMHCPVKLTVCASFPGTEETERALHERFAKARLHGEWFRLTREIEDFIRQANSGTLPIVNTGVVGCVTDQGRFRATPQQVFDMFSRIFGRGWQASAAKLLNVHPRTIIRWKQAAEKGKCIIPTFALEKMLAAYEAKMVLLRKYRDELRGGTSPKGDTEMVELPN